MSCHWRSRGARPRAVLARLFSALPALACVVSPQVRCAARLRPRRYDSDVIMRQSRGAAVFARESNWTVLDAYTMTVLRPDAHRESKPSDCVHIKPELPSVMSDWSDLLFAFAVRHFEAQHETR